MVDHPDPATAEASTTVGLAHPALRAWGTDSLGLAFTHGPDAPVVVAAVRGSLADAEAVADDAALVPATQPLVEVLAVGHGRRHANLRNTATAVGARLRHAGHREEQDGPWRVLHVDQRDDATGLEVRTTLRTPAAGRPSLQAWTTVRNAGEQPVALQAVSTLVLGHPLGAGAGPRDVVTVEGRNEWVGEGRWEVTPLRGQSGLPWLDLDAHQHQDGRGSRAVVSGGTWSSGDRAPAGALGVDAAGTSGRALAWEVEHNGAWRAEVGERVGAAPAGRGELVLGLLGPTDADHQWLTVLGPGESFTSVPASVAFSDAGWQGAVQELTRHRRLLRTGPAEPEGRWLVFNDYMNTLMGDPTTEKLLPLVDAAAAAGAEYFCIDAGWYDDGFDWWDSVGEWQPSTRRFGAAGLGAVLDRIREAGMVPGLWLEPEVVGRRSPVADALPADAFLQRAGRRVLEQDRYLLDLRHPAARAHLDAVVDRLVRDLGVGYFKLDYNVTPGPGSDLGADSAGAGLLAHNRAHLAWLDGVRRRHPHVVLENCASGAMRADYALLARLHLQSTSDQQNPVLYPPIAAAAPMQVLPEQAGNWAYPQPGMTDEEIVFTLCTGLSGRLYLSGHLDEMSAPQLALVREAVDVALARRAADETAVPFWPLGLPAWEDPWVVSGLRDGDESWVTLWWRGDGPGSVLLDLPAGDLVTAFPSAADAPGGRRWDVRRRDDGRVEIAVDGPGPSARLLRLRP
jgi:alpha-galactosidase